jgi:hypothetical protein
MRTGQRLYCRLSAQVALVGDPSRPPPLLVSPLLQPDSLYNNGMQPCIYSQALHESDGTGWHRGGFDICYYKNDHRILDMRGERYYYTLSFSWTATADEDTVFFAHCYPYTYTDLQNYLTGLVNHPARGPVCRLRNLCHTLAGNACDLVTVTNFGVSQAAMAARKVYASQPASQACTHTPSFPDASFTPFFLAIHTHTRLVAHTNVGCCNHRSGPSRRDKRFVDDERLSGFYHWR